MTIIYPYAYISAAAKLNLHLHLYLHPAWITARPGLLGTSRITAFVVQSSS